MKSGFWDHHSHQHSVIHQRSAQAKLLVFLAVAAATLINPIENLVYYFVPLLLVVILLILTKISLTHTFLKFFKLIRIVIILTILLPFFGNTILLQVNGVAIYEDGLLRMGIIMLRSSIILLMVILLNLTTAFEDLLAALQSWRVPRLFIALLSFTYRFIFNVQDEMSRIRRSWKSRAFHVRPVLQWHYGTQLLGTLFVRTLERGEQTYRAMMARGFRGEIAARELKKFTGQDAVFVGLSFAWLVLGLVLI